MATARELGIARDVRDDHLGRPAGMEVAGVVRESLNGGGVADINVFWINGGVECDAKGMVQPSRELLYLGGFAFGAFAAKHEQSAGAGVAKKEIAIGSGADETRHRECTAAENHHLFVVRPLHGGGVAAGIQSDSEAGRRDRPSVSGTWDNMGRVVDCLLGLGLGEVCKGDLAANAGLLLVPIGECSPTGDGLLGRKCRREKHGGYEQDGGGGGSHT